MIKVRRHDISRIPSAHSAMKEFNGERLETNGEEPPTLPRDIAAEVIMEQQLRHVEISEKNILPTVLGDFLLLHVRVT